MKRRLNSMLPLLAALGLLLGAGAAVGWQPGCPVRSGLGIKCPGCGAGRAVAAMASGDWQEAWYWNALLWPVLVLLGGAVFRKPWGWPAWLGLGMLGLAFGVVRNLPFYLLY